MDLFARTSSMSVATDGTEEKAALDEALDFARGLFDKAATSEGSSSKGKGRYKPGHDDALLSSSERLRILVQERDALMAVLDDPQGSDLNLTKVLKQGKFDA
jgi:hypothetical protein